MQLSNDTSKTDCLKLALLIYKAGQAWIGSGTPNQQDDNSGKFINGLLGGLTEFSSVSLTGRTPSDPNYRVGVFRAPRDPYYANSFRDTGFAEQFAYGTNEVRHFVGFLAAGYGLGIPGGLAALALHPNRNPKAVALGEKAIDLGGNFFGDYKRLAQDVWHQVCGQSGDLNLP